MPDPAGSSLSSLICTNPCPQARSISRRETNRPTAKWTCSPCPPGMPLRHPQIRQRLRPDPVAQLAEEAADMLAQLDRLVAAGGADLGGVPTAGSFFT